MTTIKKVLIINRFSLPDVIVDIVKEYAFVDISVKIQEQRLQKKKVEDFLSKGTTIESYFGYPCGQRGYIEIMLVMPYKGFHRFTNANGKKKTRRLCRLCGNFEYPKGYEYTDSVCYPGLYYNKHNPSPFGNKVLCICRQEKFYYRNNDASCPVIEHYKCNSGYNYRKLLV